MEVVSRLSEGISVGVRPATQCANTKSVYPRTLKKVSRCTETCFLATIVFMEALYFFAGLEGLAQFFTTDRIRFWRPHIFRVLTYLYVRSRRRLQGGSWAL